MSSRVVSPPTEYPLPSILPRWDSSRTSTIFYASGFVLLFLLAFEQSVYRYKKRHLPGSKWTIPIIGKFADSMHPTLEGYQRQWDSGALSALSVFHIFIVIASSNEYTRKILNSPTFTEPCLVHSAKQILEPDNWVFLTGKVHVDYRRVLNTLFTRRALGMYVPIQDSIARKYFSGWLEAAAKSNASPMPLMMTIRDLNMETSLRVFCGKYIPEEAAREISENYWKITKALELVNFPLAIPGTKVYRAIQARKIAMRWLQHAAAESKKAVAEGAEPSCMLDEWIIENIRAAAGDNGKKREFSDREMAHVLLSFLFASQDAMSSGLIYMFQHLADHPHVLTKLREEQQRVRGGDYSKPVTLEMLEEMPYLKACVKESLRTKPPVTMVPYKATRPFPISADYTVPANTMVIPSLYPSLHDPEIYPEPKKFLPERWLDPQSSANTNPKSYLVFGAGPHKCIANEYAQMHIGLVVAAASVLMNWEHVVTPQSEEVDIIATLFPKDGCLLRFTRRD